MSGSSVPGGTRGSSSFLSSQAAFWLAWFSTCFTHDADKLCAPAGLTLLSALLLLLSCFLVLYLRCQFPGEYSGETLLVLYCFLGDLCSAMGAIMSRQLHIQVTHFVFLSAVYLDMFFSTSDRRLRMAKRRRRQHLLAVGVLMVVAGGFLKSRVTDEILGYTLGLLSFVIACTSRFPFTRSYIFSRLLCSVSGALYTAAILLYNTQFGFLLRVLPWLLSATSCVLLDLIVSFCCKRATRQRRMKFGPDMESLLGGSGISAEHTGVSNQQKKPSSNISDQTKVNQISLKEAMMGKERVEGGALCSRVRLVRAGSLCSSDTSYDSSADSSDLEVGWTADEPQKSNFNLYV
uniref:Transmembrane protein 44 n=1 Tax=Oryzias melastigma TaxID=30732 RepID=A0A3B3CRF8_ORYME